MRSFRFVAMGVLALAAVQSFAQQTYNPGTFTFKRIGHNQWGKPGEFGLLDWSKQTQPAHVDIPLGFFADIVPLPGDYNTGAGLIVTLGGALGIRVQVWGKNGVLNVEYPCGITLTYPDPKTLHPGDTYTISSSYTRAGAGTMSSTAPDFGFSLAGLFDAEIKVRATVKLFGEEIVGKNILEKSWDNLEVGLFNTDLPGFKEYVNAHDGHFEFFGGIVEGDFGFPHVTTAGGNGPGNTLTSAGEDEFLSVGVSITDAVLAALGLPIDLNGVGGVDGSWGEFTWDFHFLDLRLDGGFSILQDFKFEPKPIISLAMSNGEVRTFNAGDSINLTMPAVAPGATSNNLVVSPSFTTEGTVNNHSKLRFNIGLVFDPFSLHAHIKVGGEVAGDFYGLDETIDVGLPTIDIISDYFDLDLVDKTFDMKGFNVVTTTPFTIEGFKYPSATIGQLSPVMVPLNTAPFDLTVSGSGFVDSFTNGGGTVPGTVIKLNGTSRTTTFLSSGSVKAAILASDTSVEGKKQITAFNPPPGGGNSNMLELIVDGTPPTIVGTATPLALNKTGNPNVLVSVTVSGTITDLLSGVDPTTGTYTVVDEYGQVQPSGTVTILPGGSYSFVVRLSPTRQAKDKDGRKYVVTIKAKDNLGFQGTGTVNVIATQ